jgi:hypothetical protein
LSPDDLEKDEFEFFGLENPILLRSCNSSGHVRCNWEGVRPTCLLCLTSSHIKSLAGIISVATIPSIHPV